MPLSTSISLSPQVQQQVNSAAGQFSVDAFIASALAQVVSGGDQDSVSNFGGVGVMGITTAIGMSLGYDVTQESQNIEAGVEYLSTLLQQFLGNYPRALAAYLSSPLLVLQSNGIPPLANVQSAVYNITQLAQLSGSTSVSMTRTFQNQSTMDPEPDATASAQQTVDANTKGTDYGSVSAQNTALIAQSLVPVLQDDTNGGTSEQAWFDNKVMITGNSKVRRAVQPVTFMVYLDQNNAQQVLHNPSTMLPITLQLNCSMREFNLESKHIYNRTASRTGMHVTFWGMQPDLIQGSGSTGVFMNQYGITDYFSTSSVPQSVKSTIAKIFLPTPASPRVNIGSVRDATLINLPEALRVAAQDAFTEFLKLFQMNGNVWYHTQNYQGVLTEQEQASPNAWSPKAGASSFQQHSRNNDVMTRGFVAMKYRNNVFLGYFKSLNWTMDANKPFSWDFSFTFQVEKTYSALYWPSTPATLANSTNVTPSA
jgi:hypothetical protein